MTGGPQFTPRMLRLFLLVQAQTAECDHADIGEMACETCRKAFLTDLRRRVGITVAEMDRAVAGTLTKASPRTALWRKIGHDPKAIGIRLLDGGKQEAIE